MEGRTYLEPGTVIDTYRIVRVVGAGGFGVTYEAEDICVGTTVAIKEYFPENFATRTRDSQVRPSSDRHSQTFEWGRSSFLEEASTLARFKHPSIVHVYRIFEANSTAYMVMAFERGLLFEKWLRSLGRPPSQDDLDHLVNPLLDALELMHANNLLHRDIAPDNIVIRDDLTPVLLDFGAARKTVAAKTHALTGMFKQGYSPQEQYSTDGKFQGPWSDFYALGATFYRAVTGLPPDEAPSRGLHDTLLPATQVAKGTYRPSFLAMIDACLQILPADRPQSVSQVRELLSGTGSVPLSAPTDTGSTKTATKQVDDAGTRLVESPPRKTGRVLALVLLLLLIAGSAGGYIYYRRIEAEKQAQVEAEARRLAEEALQLDGVRREIAAATTPEALDQILLREPRLRIEIDARRKLLAEIARAERHALLREQIARQTQPEALNKIAADEPDLRAEVEDRKLDLLKAAHAALMQSLKVRIPTTTDLAELDLIARQAPELSQGVEARKREIEQLRRLDAAYTIKPGSGESFRDCPTCPEMVVVPRGSFMMGSPANEPERNDDEGPQYQVTIGAAFAVGRFAVTRGEYASFVQETKHASSNNCTYYGGGYWYNATYPDKTGRSFRNPGFAQDDRHPVVCVDWNDAKAFVAWLSRKTGKVYRLLSEAEREYVTRAGTTTPFWWGSSITPKQANYDGSEDPYEGGGSKGEFLKRTVPVDSFEPNPWGLYQVHGNVQEWLEDCGHNSYQGAPGDGSAWTTTCDDSSRRQMAGGSWFTGPRELRSANRNLLPIDHSSSTRGIRVARTLKP